MPEELRATFTTAHRLRAPGSSVAMSDESSSLQEMIRSFEVKLSNLEAAAVNDPGAFFDIEGGLDDAQEKYLEIQSILSRCRREPFDQYKAITKWHCTEAFATLLTEHFRRAKQAVMQAEM